MVVLDTNVLIDHIRQSPKTLTRLQKIQDEIGVSQLGISAISVQELYRGASTRHKREEERMRRIITPLRRLPYSWETAVTAGRLMRDRTQPIEFADAAIAATVLEHKAQLLTLNQKHFADIPGLKLVKL